jgi:hypothetical protein
MIGIGLVEAGLVPDPLVRIGIRAMLRRRLREIASTDCQAAAEAASAFRE